jgi:hypothetical protein
MSDLEYQHSDALILYVTDQPIVAHAISPQSAFVAVKRLAPLSRIVRRLHALPQKSND